MRGGRIQIPLLAGHLRRASDTPFQWRFAGVPMKAQLTLNAGLVACDFEGIRASIAKEPYIS